MKKIATHDSATGEKPTWWSALLTPFARTQKKTIKQQYAAGCRLFDIRIKKVFGTWKCAHGWWFTKRTAEDIISELNDLAALDNVYVELTFEGKTKNANEVIALALQLRGAYTNIIWGPVAAKYGVNAEGLHVKYDYLLPADKDYLIKTTQAFKALDGSTWHTYLPIPWLWKQFYFKYVEFNEDMFKFVDFL